MPQGQLIREANPAQGFAAALVPQHELANGDYKATGENAPLPVSIEDGGAAAQVDMQYRKQKTVQTHAAVTIAASGNNTSAWIDTDGYESIALIFKNDASTSSYADIHWSIDGSTQSSADYTGMPTNNNQQKSVVMPTKARWFRVILVNADAAAPHTMSMWAYLKV